MSGSSASVDSDSEDEMQRAAAVPPAKPVQQLHLQGRQQPSAHTVRTGHAGNDQNAYNHLSGQPFSRRSTEIQQTQAGVFSQQDVTQRGHKPGYHRPAEPLASRPHTDKRFGNPGPGFNNANSNDRIGTNKPVLSPTVGGDTRRRGGNSSSQAGFVEKRVFSQRKPDCPSRFNTGNPGRSRQTTANKSGSLPRGGSDGSSIPHKVQIWLRQQVVTVLVSDMSSAAGEISLYLKKTQEVPMETVSGLISVIHQAMSTKQTRAVNHILQCVLDSHLLDGHFISFLERQLLTRAVRPDTLQRLSQVLDVILHAVEQFPQHAAKCHFSLKQILEKGQRLKLITPKSNLMLKAEKLIKLTTASQFQEDQTPFQYQPLDQVDRSAKTKGKIFPVPDDVPPPDDYKKLTIFPDITEIFDPVEPFLRANKTQGAYRDLHHYLDVHSRLLKEDYLEPIRQGLKDFKKAQAGGKHVKENDLRFYYDVKLVKMQCDESNGITHIAQFNIDNLENIEWEHSRRLMYGALVVLSKDAFETTIFATVSDRDETNLQKGLVELSFQSNLDRVFTSSEFDIYVMAETTAYFESYRHVLEGLQEMTDLPLSRYILSCKPDICPPAYLGWGTCVDLSCIAIRGRHFAPVQILDDDDWPDETETKLNASQLDAVKLAMSKEVAIIQGPPGTGKTYIGLCIMQILFQHFKTVRRNMRAPILVVCYTNHALDQFLEGMLGFCESGIVRVGGQSSSEALRNFNLKELRRNPKIAKRVKKDIEIEVKDCRKSLKNISQYVNNYWQQSLRQETTILSLGDLADEIGRAHRISLEDPRRQSDLNPHVISVWLRATNANMEKHINSASQRHLARLIASTDSADVISDDGLSSTLAAARAEFYFRVQIYRYWVGKLKMQLEREINDLMFHPARTASNEFRLTELLAQQDAVRQDILTDDILIPLMGNEKVFESIRECVGMETKDCNRSENTVVRQWLMGTFTAVDLVLDAIELLMKSQTASTPKKGKHKRRELNTEEFAENSRYKNSDENWVLAASSDEETDEENEEETDDEDDSDDGESGSGGGNDDIDSIDLDKIKKISQKAKFRDIQREFKQYETREIQIYQRAQMLGVDLSDTSEDDEEEEWTQSNALSHSKVFKVLHDVTAFTESEVSEIHDVWELTLRDRYRLYKYWVQERKAKLTENLIELTKEYRSILARKREAINRKDVEILRAARVIGMTTSGAANRRAVLQKVGSRVVVVEEAAEVLEAHIVTALNAKVQHLILIGDHQQLRPNPTVYRLAKDYDLEISLFERLVKNRFPRATLDEQHRMRPEIAEFVRHIYPQLEDHQSVSCYSDIEGVASNVFFVQHNYEERDVDDSTSRANTHEARFLTALCKYFLQHGYEASQITILAAYSGQVAAIREAMQSEEDTFEPVRVTSIDNFQGEENDIILLSLVRSNKDNNVGFLKTDNRVCVALSRAKKGLFVIGNLKQLAFKSQLWKKILTTAKENNVTGVDFKLLCVNHGHATYVNCMEDFQNHVPEGGCSKPCGQQLHCGHTCLLTCHSWDRTHSDTVCKQPCLKHCPEGHPCPLTCAEQCGPCQVPVVKLMPGCQHEDQVPCHEDVREHLCSQLCNLTLPCGHQCRGRCGKCSYNGRHLPCLDKVEKAWPLCGHNNTAECYKDPAIEPCTTKCKETLSCGHKCKGSCGTCLGGRVHVPCQTKCEKLLPCGHQCQSPCGGVCMPCNMRCPTTCRHGKCSRQRCGDLCQPCLENCAMTCGHNACTQRCLDDCSVVPCTRQCGKPVVKCKHKCVSLCGEQCVCYSCGKDELVLIDTNKARKHQPKWLVAHEQKNRSDKFTLTPSDILMKIPGCKHVFTLKQLDKYVENQGADGSSYIHCPVCPSTIQCIRRYDAANKQRTERRHAQKEKLIEDTKVSFAEVSQLKDSLKLVKSYIDVDEREYLNRDNVMEIIDPNDVLSFRAKIRFAWALRKIEQIDIRYNKESAFRPDKWKRSIQAVRKNVSPQFWEEMRLELHRLLLSQQFLALNSFLKNCYISSEPEITAAMSALKAELKVKLSPHNLSSCQRNVVRLYDKFMEREEEDYYRNMVSSLKSHVLLISACLDASKDQDLCFILKQNRDDASDDLSEDESSDETSTEEETDTEFSSDSESNDGSA
ncbi:nfx1-type Zinc finger-containing protein 1 [Plakobranchus ocellatus]|uniref:Nfx1-type Zinc finger-containing protein 1 n=1 Tax=Plakobranchus ocellatus TaxID=259542 RepID=A0AAV4BAX3_9GAST|nr:nfx1-type Zinc finger-containing protein 1 [Plakobranchus ocellatus]